MKLSILKTCCYQENRIVGMIKILALISKGRDKPTYSSKE